MSLDGPFTNLSDQIKLGMHGLKSAQRILHPLIGDEVEFGAPSEGRSDHRITGDAPNTINSPGGIFVCL